jgi:hypothetical protein
MKSSKSKGSEKSAVGSVRILALPTYLAMIRNSVGTRLFSRLYAAVDGRRRDLLDGGNLACAFFVTGILAARGLVCSMHATVEGTVRDMEKSGWHRTDRLRTGAVLVWEEAEQVPGSWHRHIGFYLGKGRAVSNDSRLGQPVEHHWTFGKVGSRAKRRVVAVYWHDLF